MLWLVLAPALEAGGDRRPLQAEWQRRQELIAAVPQALAGYRAQVAQDQQQLQRAKGNAKQGAIILSGVIGFISFALSIALAVVLTRQIVSPVVRLRDALQQVASGNLSPQAPMCGRDEISQLLTTFNASVGRLRDLLLGVRAQAQAISQEAGLLKRAFAGTEMTPRDAAVLQDTLAAAGRLAQATDAVSALVGPGAPGDLRALTPAGDGSDLAGELAVEGAQVLDELTRAVERVSVCLGAVTDRADRLVSSVATGGASSAPSGVPAGLADELRALDTDAKAAATQLEALIQEVRSTQHMTGTALANLDRAAGYLHTAVEQFHLQS